MKALIRTEFILPGQVAKYTGKVRDVYSIGKDYLVMVATDRISAFDVVLPEGIPFKGQVLNQIASKFLDATADIIPNWKIAEVDPMATIGWRCEPFKVEMVIRGYLTGHAWREYKAGKRSLCGVPLPDGMVENQRFPEPIITPTTKAAEGHDEDISKEDIIARGIVGKEDYEQLEKYTRALFARGTEMAAGKGLILVDTKYEFGKLSKEFVREWLMANGFQGQAGQKVPEMTPQVVAGITDRYIELYENITGAPFAKAEDPDPAARIEKNIDAFLKTL